MDNTTDPYTTAGASKLSMFMATPTTALGHECLDMFYYSKVPAHWRGEELQELLHNLFDHHVATEPVWAAFITACRDWGYHWAPIRDKLRGVEHPQQGAQPLLGGAAWAEVIALYPNAVDIPLSVLTPEELLGVPTHEDNY